MGFDISSKTIGYSVLDLDDELKKIKLYTCDHFSPPKNGSIFERIDCTQNKIKELLELYKPDDITIEDIAGGFTFGKSTSTTLIVLATFNRSVGMVCYKYLGKSPHLYTVMSIRHATKLGKELPKKEDIPALVEKILKIKFPYVMKKKRNGTQEIDMASYDRADSINVALCHINKLRKLKNEY